MAITQNPLIGRASGKFGGAVFATLFGQNILRTLPVEVRNPRTPAQTAQRNLFKQAALFIKAIYPFILHAFPIGLCNMVPFSYVLSKVVKRVKTPWNDDPEDVSFYLNDFVEHTYSKAISLTPNVDLINCVVDVNALYPQVTDGDTLHLVAINVALGTAKYVSEVVPVNLEVDVDISLPGTTVNDDIVVFVSPPSRLIDKPGAELASKVS
jgi:hypothetical protein